MIKAKNKDGEWVPAIEEPIQLLWWFECVLCDRKFRSLEIYRGHYALKHILKLD